MNPFLKILSIVGTGLAMAACSSAPQGGVTPTVEAIVSTATPEATLTLTPSLTLVDQPVEQVAVSSSTPTPTAEPPTLTPLPSPTSGPYEYTIQAGDTLGYIVGTFGYQDLSIGPGSIIDEVVRLNDSIQSADILPGPGTVILVPRQTATPTPENVETAVAVEATSAASVPNIPEFETLDEYIVQPDDTIVAIAQLYNTTLGVLFSLNPDLDGIFSCDPQIPSGGPNCNVNINVGQIIQVPAPTPTPTLSPTPSGNETATPTPTLPAPVVIFPPENASVGAGVFSLQWVGVGVLQPDEVYLIQVTDLTLNTIALQAATRNTSFVLPESLIPTDGQPHSFSWMVWVAKPNADRVYGRVGGAAVEHTFIWQSR
ncbi:MAG: LysM domain-containing protein [Chloroflexi bacterium]|nr:LysM domain-containing protein [Chloroflexota bacterium]MCC6891346.1 LysM peptidoglycan-binding domain-containing protein [Anaerolineae bacterium]